ncbi:FAD-binding oxidoreductase [Virgibacillus sp. NKC19-16]|uniref:NAD(P)/FAD-dependent oxidoreductase n=1 Tax=Virgibacillus salidurans TaxID=2831673 RepID=UPI002104A52F|nr:FAD-dependent oxidoreductase [Virgibacillus sp. NKC19-16]UJL47203.1 FAD-binding oxidoreductase [Virgibacillus sp. NKC19-16]
MESSCRKDKKVGALTVNSDSEMLDEIESRARSKQKDAPEMGDISRLSAAQTRERFPLLNEDLKSVFLTGAARVDGRLLRNALKRAAQKHGAEMIKGEAKLLYNKNSVEGVEVNGEKLYANTVLIATGAWAPSLLAPLGINLNVEPQRGQIAHIHVPNEDTSDWPVVLPQSRHYMLAFDDARIVVGATRETGVGFDYRTTAGGVHEVTSEALNVAPGLSNGTLQEVRIGFRPMGPDVLPILGGIDVVKGVVLATGLGASGLTMGPYIGRLAAALAGGENSGVDLTPYNPMRAITSGVNKIV